MYQIFTEGKTFRDSEGRERIFTGINICEKGKADSSNTAKEYLFDITEEEIKRLKDSGFNIVRLGTTWDAVEPEPGKYSSENIARMKKVADLCEKHGIYYYLDMHQDLYGGPCDGPADGAPKWACITDGYKFKPTKFVWAEGYFWGKAVHKSFDNFWKDTPLNGTPIQKYYRDMWQHLVSQFGDSPALFGYDLMNEPFPGTDGGKVFRKLILSVAKTVITDKRCPKTKMLKNLVTKGNAIKVLEPFDNPDVFRKVTKAGDALIRKFDLEAYSPFLNKTAAAVRKVNKNGIIFMENCYYSNLGIPCSTPAVTIDGTKETNQCFAPHGYDLMVDTPAYKYASNSRVGSIFDEHKRTQERLDVPVLVGEWGGQSDGYEWLHHINYLLNKFDSNKWSNTYWCFYKGVLDNPVMTALKRPHPVAVTGDILSYCYDIESNSFELNYVQGKEYSVPTEIYLHKKASSIECNGEYEFKEYDCGDCGILEVKTKPGNNTIKINF